MLDSNSDELLVGVVSNYDRKSEPKAFDDSKSGVQGLIENGVTKVPNIFHCPQSDLKFGSASESKFTIPIIDLTGINVDSIQRVNVVGKVRHACEKWGFFRVINQGIPTHVLDDMIRGTFMFHQQDVNVRKEFYTRDLSRKVVYFGSNFSMHNDPAANWKDTLGCFMAPHAPNPEKLPSVCRFVIIIQLLLLISIIP